MYTHTHVHIYICIHTPPATFEKHESAFVFGVLFVKVVFMSGIKKFFLKNTRSAKEKRNKTVRLTAGSFEVAVFSFLRFRRNRSKNGTRPLVTIAVTRKSPFRIYDASRNFSFGRDLFALSFYRSSRSFIRRSPHQTVYPAGRSTTRRNFRKLISNKPVAAYIFPLAYTFCKRQFYSRSFRIVFARIIFDIRTFIKCTRIKRRTVVSTAFL